MTRASASPARGEPNNTVGLLAVDVLLAVAYWRDSRLAS